MNRLAPLAVLCLVATSGTHEGRAFNHRVVLDKEGGGNKQRIIPPT